MSDADRCDPFISVYAPPEPSRIGDLAAIRWTGFITSDFLKDILETILCVFCVSVGAHSTFTIRPNRSPNIPSPDFVSVTVHAVPTSPITYIPDDVSKAHPSLRAPRTEAEDTLSLVYMRGEGAAEEAGHSWIVAESIGRCDKRWG